MIKNEPVEVALERSVSHMLSWANDNNSQFNHYFLYVSLSRACYDIRDGKVSPWLVLNCTSGKDMLRKFNDEQLMAVNVVMDVPFWLSKFKRSPGDVNLVKDVVKESMI